MIKGIGRLANSFLTPLGICLALLGICTPAAADYTLNMPEGVTPTSHAIYNLHMLIFWVCVGIGIIVFSVMFYSIIRHRKSKGAKAASFHESTSVEIIWAVIPFLILVVMAIPATKTLILMDDTADADINIKITGYQWKWQYEYLDNGIEFFSNLSTPKAQIEGKETKGEHYLLEVDNPLVVPVNKKIRFLVTSKDVIHSWWVPQFGVKRDAVPGFIHESWAKIEKPGIYRGQCAELCGVGHGYMPIVVIAMNEPEYDAWVEEQKQKKADVAKLASKKFSKDELMEKGEKTYEQVCAVCHQVNGAGMPPTFPALKSSVIATGPVADHINLVLHGKNGTAMQAFATQLSDVDLAAVITYERNAWGNETGDVVQPSDIAAAKGSEQDTAAQPASAKEGGQDAAEQPATAEKKRTQADIDKEYSKEELMKIGEDVYLGQCAACHQANGKGIPPAFPSLVDGQIVNGPKADHIKQVVDGKQGTAMQAFKALLNPVELAAVITYERNAWNDGKGDVVQPKEIQQYIANH